jgi:hypothetical protein
MNKVQIEATAKCPVHGGDCKKEYTFGNKDFRAERPSVYVFSGCGCAVCDMPDSAGRSNMRGVYHFANYAEAANYARFGEAKSNQYC